MKKLSLLFSAVAIIALSGCAGYHTGAGRPTQLANVRKLAVPTFKNSTLIPRMEVLVTDAVIKQLQMDGAYKIVSSDDADAVLKGEITGITRHQFRAQRDNTLQTTEILVGMVVKYKIDDKEGTTLIAGQTRAQSNLVLDPNFQLTERQALADSAERLSADLVGQVAQGW